jgi:hypothetical protein
VFAWDDPTAYGSLVEIGYAKALNKRVHLYFDQAKDLADLWLASQVSTAFSQSENPFAAWDDFCLRLRHGTW